MNEYAPEGKGKWPEHMAPPELKSGRFVEDEKLLMKCLVNPDLVLKGQSIADFGKLYNRVALAYMKRLARLKSSAKHEE